MFTFISQFRKQLMIWAMHFMWIEWPQSLSEAEARLAEIREITQTTQESLLDFRAAMEFFWDEDASLDISVRNTNPEVSKDIQELLSLISHKSWNDAINPGKADGWFGPWTEGALNAYLDAKWLNPDGVVTQEVYNQLIQDSRINEYTRLISEWQEHERQEVRERLTRFGNLDEIRELSSAERVQVQEDLFALGFDSWSTTGIVWPKTTEAFNQFLDQELQREAEEVSERRLRQAEAEVREAEALLLEVESIDYSDDIATIESSINQVVTQIGELMRERSTYEELIPDLQLREIAYHNTTRTINRLLERKNELDIALEQTQNTVDYAREELEDRRWDLYEAQQEFANIEIANDYASKSIEQMSRNERAALQRHINAIRAVEWISPIWVDGLVGPQTRWALENLGFTASQENYIKLRDRALVARNTRQLELSQEEINDYPYLNVINNALENITMRSSPEDIQSSMDILMHHVNLATDWAEGWLAENMNERRVISQFITAKAATMVDEWIITALQASQITEALLSVQNYPEGGPNRDQISRMLGTISELRRLTRDEQWVEIAANLDQQWALNAIVRSSNSMSMWDVLTVWEFPNGLDIDLAENMYIVTWNGLQTLAIRDTAALEVRKWALVWNTIVGLMDNGCNGNVIYIPLDYTPPVQRTQTRTPKAQPQIPTPQPEIPEWEWPRTRVTEECINNRIHIVTWIMRPGRNYWTRLSIERTPTYCNWWGWNWWGWNWWGGDASTNPGEGWDDWWDGGDSGGNPGWF